jgi:hypothetical protein
MEQPFELAKLFATYSDLVTGHYKHALSDLMNSNGEFEPPQLDVVDATLTDAAQHIQNCSAYYNTVSKLASYARSAFSLAEGLYKHRFKQELGRAPGSNAANRESYAVDKTSQEYDQMLFYQSAMILFESLEKSARIAADSSRKMAELIQSQHIAEMGNKY